MKDNIMKILGSMARVSSLVVVTIGLSLIAVLAYLPWFVLFYQLNLVG